MKRMVELGGQGPWFFNQAVSRPLPMCVTSLDMCDLAHPTSGIKVTGVCGDVVQQTGTEFYRLLHQRYPYSPHLL